MINVPQWRSHLHFPYFFLSWMLTCWSENVSAKLQKIRLLLKNTRIAIDEFLQRTLACVVLIFFIAWVHNAHKSTTYRNLNPLIDSTYATDALIKTSHDTSEACIKHSPNYTSIPYTPIITLKQLHCDNFPWISSMLACRRFGLRSSTAVKSLVWQKKPEAAAQVLDERAQRKTLSTYLC